MSMVNKCRKLKQDRVQLIIDLVKDLVKYKYQNEIIEEMLIIEDILRHLGDDNSHELEANQGILGM